MSMTPTDQTVTKAPRRSLKPAAAFAAAGLLATVAWVGAHQTGDDVRTDKTRLEALDDRTVETAGRHSRELAAPPTSSDSGEPTSTEPTSAGPTTTGTGPLTTAPTTTDRNGVGTSGGSGRASGSCGPLLGQAGTATGPSRDQSPGGGDGTLWLPGTDAEAPITGPPAVLPDQPGESDPPSAEEWDAPSELPEADPSPSIDDVDVDELRRWKVPGVAGKPRRRRAVVETCADREHQICVAAGLVGGVPGATAAAVGDPVADAATALQQLGYKPADAVRMARDAAAAGDEAAAIIRKALQSALR